MHTDREGTIKIACHGSHRRTKGCRNSVDWPVGFPCRCRSTIEQVIPEPKLTKAQFNYLLAVHQPGEHTSGELAELFGVARSSIYRAIENQPMVDRPGLGLTSAHRTR
jgi:hypothetical protein